MLNPFHALLDRCSRGFTISQKLAMTIAGLLWVISPLDFDFVPVLGWIDDAFVLAMIRKVWMSPTLPRPSGGLVAVHLKPKTRR